MTVPRIRMGLSIASVGKASPRIPTSAELLSRFQSRRRVSLGMWFLAWVAAVSVPFIVQGCELKKGWRVAPLERSCEINLGMLAKGIAAYRNEHGRCPHIYTSSTKHMHSWRVRILPYVLAHYDNGHKLIEAFDYRFQEAWNSEHNRDQTRSAPWDCFTCPCESRSVDYPLTSYLMLVRPTREKQRKEALPPAAVIVVESVHCGIKHAEPKDLDWKTLWQGDSPFGEGKLHSLHPGVVKALRVDGEVIDIPKDIGNDELRELLNGTGKQ